MEMLAHNPNMVIKGKTPSSKVAKEFAAADEKSGKFRKKRKKKRAT